MYNHRDFIAMAVRAAFATGSDGVVFSNTSRDALEHDWEALSEETRTNWRDLSELLTETLRHPLTVINPTDTTVTH